MHDHLRAALVLAAASLMTLLGLPGLDRYKADAFIAPKERQKARQTAIGRLEVTAADINRLVRLPVVAWFEPLQRPLRLSQSWYLYSGGPNRVRRVEIHIDGRLVHRTNAADADWLGPLLRYRKVRPMLVAVCDSRSRNEGPLIAWLVARAQQDFPGCTSFAFQCLASPFPGRDAETVDVAYHAAAPSWVVQ